MNSCECRKRFDVPRKDRKVGDKWKCPSCEMMWVAYLLELKFEPKYIDWKVVIGGLDKEQG